MRLLIVEDEERLAATLARGLRAEGYAVDLAADGLEGLELATTNPYGAIVLDLLLPWLNGYRVRAQLRAAGNRTPVLMLTAKQVAVLECLARRAGEVVAKVDVLDEVWDAAYDGDVNVVEVHVHPLRRKLDEPFGLATIQTVRGAGYRLVPG